MPTPKVTFKPVQRPGIEVDLIIEGMPEVWAVGIPIDPGLYNCRDIVLGDAFKGKGMVSTNINVSHDFEIGWATGETPVDCTEETVFCRFLLVPMDSEIKIVDKAWAAVCNQHGIVINKQDMIGQPNPLFAPETSLTVEELLNNFLSKVKIQEQPS